jgi:hypothetical protein
MSRKDPMDVAPLGAGFSGSPPNTRDCSASESSPAECSASLRASFLDIWVPSIRPRRIDRSKTDGITQQPVTAARTDPERTDPERPRLKASKIDGCGKGIHSHAVVDVQCHHSTPA